MRRTAADKCRQRAVRFERRPDDSVPVLATARPVPHHSGGLRAARPLGQTVRTARPVAGRGVARYAALLARDRRRRAALGVPVAARRRLPASAAAALRVLLARVASTSCLPNPVASGRHRRSVSESDLLAATGALAAPAELPALVPSAAARERATRSARAAATAARHGLGAQLAPPFHRTGFRSTNVTCTRVVIGSLIFFTRFFALRLGFAHSSSDSPFISDNVCFFFI